MFQFILITTDILLVLGILFLIYYFVFIIRRRQKNLSNLIERVSKENESLKKEISKLISEKDILNSEYQNFRNRLRSSSHEIDPRNLKIGDVYFTDHRYSDLFSVLDIKNMTLRVENVNTGEKSNVQYPFDMAGIKHYMITSGMNKTNDQEELIDYKTGC